MPRTLRFASLIAAIALAVTACDSGGQPPVGAGEVDPAATAVAAEENPTPAPPSDEPAAANAENLEFATATRLGAFDVAEVPEASGLAASRRHPGWLYVVDDRVGTTSVVAVRVDGSDLRRLEIAGFEARNTEDLAVATCGPGLDGTCLYVGDIGDNVEARDAVDVWRLPEPALPGVEGPAADGPLDAVRARLAYPDGPRDAEALMVDGGGSPFLLSKSGADAPRLYGGAGFGDQTLADHGAVDLPDPALGLAAAIVGNVVTAGDLGPRGVLVRTYDAVLHYRPPVPDAPLSSLPSWTSVEVSTPPEVQGEALAWRADDCGYVTVSEGVGDIWGALCTP